MSAVTRGDRDESLHVVNTSRGDDPSDRLVDLADELKAGLIVIGLPRRTPTGKRITGSQAQRILLDANCPVQAVKAD